MSAPGSEFGVKTIEIARVPAVADSENRLQESEAYAASIIV